MVPIQGRSLLDYWLELLEQSPKLGDIVINTHYLPTSVETFIAKRKSRGAIRLTYEETLRGTAGTLRKLATEANVAPLLVAHADNLTLFDLGAFIRSHEQRPDCCNITAMTFQTDQPTSCGIFELDEQGIVQVMHEKVANPPPGPANAAVFIFDRDALEEITQENFFGVREISTDILPRFMGRIFTHHNSTYHRDIGTPESLRRAQEEFPVIYSNFLKAQP